MTKEEVFIKLSHFLAPDDSSELSESILKFVIKESLLNRESVETGKLAELIKGEFDLEFENQELKTALEELVTAKEIIRKDGKLFLAQNTKAAIAKKVDEAKQQETKFSSAMRELFLGISPTLTPDELDALQEDFLAFINSLFVKLGAECVHLLYPDREKLTKFIESLENEETLKKLPSRNQKIESFRREHFAGLLKLLKDEQKTYLSNKLNATFLFTLISIDPRCSIYLQQTIKGYELYLDTNFLYNLLNLDGRELEEFAKKLLDITKKFSFSLFITTRTLEEFNTSLSNAETFLRRHPLPSKDPELLRAGADSLDEAVVKAYWNRYADERIGLEEFLSFYKNVKGILGGFGVKITNKLVKETKKETDILKAIIDGLRQFAPSKNDMVAEHDAFHISLVNRVREMSKRDTASMEIKHWFLTNDRSLLRYELSQKRKDKNYFPLCILPEHLLQILRPLLPRSTDYEKSLLGFVAGHHQAGYGSLSPTLAFEILERVDRYKTKPKDVAIKVLTDAHFAHKLKTVRNKVKREEEIDNELLRRADEAIKDKNVALQQSQKLGNLRYKLEKENEELRKFKEEVESRQVKRSTVFRWSLFIVIQLAVVGVVGFGAYQLIKLLVLQGFNGVLIVILAVVLWLIVLLTTCRMLPENHSDSLRDDVKFLLSLGQKFMDRTKKD